MSLPAPVISVAYNIGIQVALRQVPDVMGPELRLVGPAAVHCDWVREGYDLHLSSRFGFRQTCLHRSVSKIPSVPC